jgi:hypothetical protein
MKPAYSQAADLYDSLESKITSVNRKELLYKLLLSLIYTFIIFTGIGFLFTLGEASFHFTSGIRKIIYWGYLSTFTTTVVYFISNYILKRTGAVKPFELIDYSRKLGSRFPEINDSLPNSLSLFRALKNGENERTIFSGELIAASLADTHSRTQKADLYSAVRFRRLRKISVILLLSFIIYGAGFAIFPGFLGSAVKRIVNYEYDYITGDYGISFTITPGDIEAPRGESVDVKIFVNKTSSELEVNEIEFYTKTLTNDDVELLSDRSILKPEKNGAANTFNTRIENISGTTYYFAKFKDAKSKEYKITVADFPVVKSFTATIFPPEFLQMPSKTLKENEGDIYCAEGSRVYIDLQSNRELSTAGIMLNGNFIPFEVNGKGARGTFAAAEGTYTFLLKDKEGRENKNPATYTIKLIKDEAPKITILEPKEPDYILSGERDLMLRARISDDYGFTGLTIGYRKLNARSSAAGVFTYENIGLKNPDATSLEVPYLWNIGKLGIHTGDVIEYFMEVTDNTGKKTRSETRTLHYKPMGETYKKTEELSKDMQTDIKSLLENVQDITKDIQEVKKEAQQNEELGLNDSQKKMSFQNKVDNLQEKMNSMQNKIDEGMKDLQKNNELSSKTLDEFMKLQELFNKINTPELQEMIKKLKEALKKNNPSDLKEAMKNFKFDEEAFKKELEKAMELMKKIEAMQKFGELTQKLDEITKKQDELKNETEKSDKDQNKMNELSEKQKQIKEETKDYKDQLKELIDKMKKLQEKMNTDGLEKLKKQMEQKNTESKMQKSSDQLQKGEKKSSEDTQQEISDDLNEMNKEMQDALSDMMNSSNSNKSMEQMKNIKKELERLSKEQGELRDKTKDLNKNNKSDFNQAQQEQQGLQKELSKNIDDLMNASKEGMPVTPELGKELGNAYNKMDKAGKDLSNSDKANASSNQGNAKESLDNAAKMLGNMIGKQGQQGKQGQNGQQGSNGSKMSQLMQQLAQMISQQQGLNGQMSQMSQMNKQGEEGQNGQEGNNGKKGNSENQSGQDQASMQRLQMQQEQIKKSLEQLNEELKKEQENTGEKVLGDLNEVKKQMEEVIKDMMENKVTDKTIEKQNRIVSRMLDAKLSQREKDFEQKRESKPGQNYVRTSPPEIVLSGPKSFNALKEDILQLQKEGFSEGYEELITRYLNELKKLK